MLPQISKGQQLRSEGKLEDLITKHAISKFEGMAPMEQSLLCLMDVLAAP